MIRMKIESINNLILSNAIFHKLHDKKIESFRNLHFWENSLGAFRNFRANPNLTDIFYSRHTELRHVRLLFTVRCRSIVPLYLHICLVARCYAFFSCAYQTRYIPPRRRASDNNMRVNPADPSVPSPEHPSDRGRAYHLNSRAYIWIRAHVCTYVHTRAQRDVGNLQ